MSSKHFCLKWNSFQSSILNAFESLQHSEDLVDVTLTCEGINLKAHKFILSACSPYFRTVFKENPCPHPIVILKDVIYTDLIAIINFMYHGEVMVSEEQLPSFLSTAKLLQVSGLNSPENKKASTYPKKVKLPYTTDSPFKKLKTKLNKDNSTQSPNRNNELGQGLKESSSNSECSAKSFEHIEIEQIKTENVDDDQLCSDINENVEVVNQKSDQQASILEAALDSKRSILERSLTAHQNFGKSPSGVPYLTELMPIIPDVPKAVFIPRKPPELELERHLIKSPSSDSGSSLSYERPSEILQQSLQVDGEQFDSSEAMPPDGVGSDSGLQIRSLDMQPHHSSQCGNCPHCGKIYSNQSALKYHVRLVHSDLTNMYCCHLCPEAFDFREGYKKHMAEVHSIRN